MRRSVTLCDVGLVANLSLLSNKKSTEKPWDSAAILVIPKLKA